MRLCTGDKWSGEQGSSVMTQGNNRGGVVNGYSFLVLLFSILLSLQFSTAKVWFTKSQFSVKFSYQSRALVVFVWLFLSFVLSVDNWSIKAKRRRTEGTGRMRYVKTITRRLKNGFREGTKPVQKKRVVASGN